ncbi:hypothetical protein [Nesterenkonia sp. K-15-9-6]|uniref:hypothetical protein n=1 Tax=Nesterenkonia sp. K-15-9-6 TaxID=3093918 RepID=UPI00404509E8
MVIGTSIPGVQAEVTAEKVLQNNVSGRGLLSRAENLVSGIPERVPAWEDELDSHRHQLEQLRGGSGASFDRAEELARMEEEFTRLDAEINGTDLSEETEAEPVSGEELLRIIGSDELSHAGGPKEGDVIKQSNTFATVAVTQETAEAPAEVFTYDADEFPDRPSDEQLRTSESCQRLSRHPEPALISRHWDQLTEFERAVGQVDPDAERVVEAYQLGRYPVGTPVTVRSSSGEGLVDAVIKEKGPRGATLMDAEGRELERFKDYSAGRTIVRGIAEQIAKERQDSAERAARRAKERSPYQFIPGEVLAEDIESFGRAGDVVVSSPSHRSQALDPETGQVRDYRGYPSPGEYETLPPAYLTGEEMEALYGVRSLRVRADELRCGDVVEATQIHTQGTAGQKVQIVSRTPMAYSDDARMEFTYRPVEGGANEEGRKKASTVVEVLARTTGALKAQERARLYWPDREQADVRGLSPADAGTAVTFLPADGVLAREGTVEVITDGWANEETVVISSPGQDRVYADRASGTVVQGRAEIRELYTEGEPQRPVATPGIEGHDVSPSIDPEAAPELLQSVSVPPAPGGPAMA